MRKPGNMSMKLCQQLAARCFCLLVCGKEVPFVGVSGHPHRFLITSSHFYGSPSIQNHIFQLALPLGDRYAPSILPEKCVGVI